MTVYSYLMSSQRAGGVPYGGQFMLINSYCCSAGLTIDYRLEGDIIGYAPGGQLVHRKLRERLGSGDIVVVCKLSSEFLGILSLSVAFVQAVGECGATLISVQDNLKIRPSNQMDFVRALDILMAEERCRLYDRLDKAPAASAKKKGRPKADTTEYDKKREEIRGCLAKKMSQVSIARLHGFNVSGFYRYLKNNPGLFPTK